MTPERRVLEGELHRERRGRRKRFTVNLPEAPASRPARVAITLAMAHRIREEILAGEIRDQADAARRLGLTRARLSQILDLTNLAPDLQESILFLEVVEGREPQRERSMRGVLRSTSWEDQRVIWHLAKGRVTPARHKRTRSPEGR